jgi:hypothetical protein
MSASGDEGTLAQLLSWRLARLGQFDGMGVIAERAADIHRVSRRHRRQVAAVRAVAAVELAAGFWAAHHQEAQCLPHVGRRFLRRPPRECFQLME